VETEDDGRITFVIFENNEMFTSYINNEKRAYQEYIKHLERMESNHIIQQLMNIAGTLIRRHIAIMVQEECEACEIQDPSQMHHTCMINWSEKISLYYDRAYNQLKNANVYGLYVCAIIGDWSSVTIPVEAEDLKEVHRVELRRSVEMEPDDIFMPDSPQYKGVIDKFFEQ